MTNQITHSPPGPELGLHIAAVERETGLGKDTLRVWERRYGFPLPVRDARGERVYPTEQVQRLRTIKRLLDQGMRPRHTVGLSAQALDALAHPAGRCEPDALAPFLTETIATHWSQIKSHQATNLRQTLKRDLLRLGAMGFMQDVVIPLNHAVGEGWAQGQIEIFEEHLYTETVTSVLRQAIAAAHDQQAAERPVVLLTTLPHEPHALGLLMAQTALSMAAANCVGLGPQTPVHDIAKGAQAHRADIVALSFSPLPLAKAVTEGVTALRAALPPQTELWLGGSHPSLSALEGEGVVVLPGLGAVDTAIAAWRSTHSDMPAHR